MKHRQPRLVFPIPQTHEPAGGSPASTPHIWGDRAPRQKPKLEEFSPFYTGYPQFFASYPQPGAAAGLFTDFEEPYM